LNSQELEARLRLVARIPGARVKPMLKKSTFGLTDLVLEVTDLEDTGTVALSNDGNHLTSKGRVTADVLMLSSVLSVPGTQYFGGYTVNYQRPVGFAGGRLVANMSSLFYRLDYSATGNSAIRYEGGSQLFELQYERPVSLAWLGQSSLLWFVGAERRDALAATVYNTTFDHPAGFRYVDGHDKIMALTGGLKYERFDDWWGLRGQTGLNLSLKRALPGWFGSMDTDAIANKLENLKNRVEPVLGPIGDVRGMRPDFLKLYATASRSQTLPASIMMQGSATAEWTSAHRIPQSYDFTGADNGSSGVRLNMSASRPFGVPGLVLGGGYTQAYAISYYRDVAGGGAPGCQKTVGVFLAASIGRNFCSAGNAFVTLGYRDKNVFADLVLNGPQANFVNAQSTIRFNSGWFW